MTKKGLIRKLADEVRTMNEAEYERLTGMLGITEEEKCISIIREILDTIEKYESSSIVVPGQFKRVYKEAYEDLRNGGSSAGTTWECLMDLGDLRSAFRSAGCNVA